MTIVPGIGRLTSGRSPDFAAYLRRAAERGVCPLCDADKTEKFICEGTYWRAWHCRFPYSGHEHHIILATKEHWGVENLTDAGWEEWARMNAAILKSLGLPGGGIFMRFGGLEYNAGTLLHLHSHIQVPDRQLFAINVLYKDEALARFLQVEK